MTSKSTMDKHAGDPVKFSKDSTGKVVELWIERSRWARVNVKHDDKGVNGNSRLLNEEGGMCCLGFYSRACGVPVKNIYGACTPASLMQMGDKYPAQMKWLVDGIANSDDADNLMSANDQEERDGLDRISRKPKAQERRVREIFAENGVKIRFVK